MGYLKINDNEDIFNVNEFNPGINIDEEHSSGLRIDQKCYKWKPKQDITTFELAKCIPVMTANVLDSDIGKLVNNLPENCQRHFNVIE
jgi:hypothetical protein